MFLKEITPKKITPLSSLLLLLENTTGSAVSQSGTLLPGIIKISNFLSRTWDKSLIYKWEIIGFYFMLKTEGCDFGAWKKQRNDKPWKIFSLRQGSIQCNHSCTTFLRTSNVQDLGHPPPFHNLNNCPCRHVVSSPIKIGHSFHV
ncbi:hypothetical protein VIGAN_10075400 [Vigna angularis var. angularis]|uniref:Uncharacterized protein n=1 Tax=Vigna angularis var. angularis TaxID=157739 RepID=A0A0S3T2V4_PHAAN|nr:hypothetical protein VIGAN_10075400 [Vigna angularis var. angularis]